MTHGLRLKYVIILKYDYSLFYSRAKNIGKQETTE